MDAQMMEFQSKAIKPMECLKGGWALVKPRYWRALGVCVLGLFIATLAPFDILMGPMLCGIYICLLAAMDERNFELGDLFKGFDYFLQSFLASMFFLGTALLLIIPIVVIQVFLMVTLILHGGGAAGGSVPGFPGGIAGVLLFVLFILVILVFLMLIGVFLQFTFPLIVERKLGAWDAIKTSFRGAKANFGRLFILYLLLMLLSLGAMLFCYVGVFFVVPISFAACALAYRQVFPKLKEAAE